MIGNAATETIVGQCTMPSPKTMCIARANPGSWPRSVRYRSDTRRRHRRQGGANRHARSSWPLARREAQNARWRRPSSRRPVCHYGYQEVFTSKRCTTPVSRLDLCLIRAGRSRELETRHAMVSPPILARRLLPIGAYSIRDEDEEMASRAP
jgi:hypothetical protein